jgi:hypothetical protein
LTVGAYLFIDEQDMPAAGAISKTLKKLTEQFSGFLPLLRIYPQ